LHGISVSSAILDAMPDAGVLVDGDGTIVYANARVDDLLGWPVAELLGRPVEDLVPATIAPHHRTLRARYNCDPRARPMGSGLELNALCRDGTELAVEISLGPMRLNGADFVIAAIRDGRPHRELRSALVDARDHLRGVIENLADGLLEYDVDVGRYLMANPRFCEMVGHTVDEVLAIQATPPWWDPDEIDTIQRLRDDAIAGRIARYELGLHRSDGSRFRVLVTANVLRRDGRTLLIGLFHDLTEEQHAAGQLEASRSRVALLEDRERIARDLHDGVIQRLFAAGLHLQAAIGRADQTPRLMQVIDEIDDSIKEIRTTIFTLHSQRGLSTSLEHGLRVAVAEASRLLGHDPELRLGDEIENIPEELGAEIITVVRELLTNIVKHADATASFVDLSIESGKLRLIVGDNGVGLGVANDAGSGLKNIADRAARRGGESTASPNSPAGTIVTWRVPLA
jgi:PAS domain S-box-containing protein